MSDIIYGGICPFCGEFVEQSGSYLSRRDKSNHLENECDEYDEKVWYEAKKEDGEVEKV